MPGQIPVATRQFSDYIPWPDLTETAVQDAIPTESYGNSGLMRSTGSAYGRLGAWWPPAGEHFFPLGLEPCRKIVPLPAAGRVDRCWDVVPARWAGALFH